MWIYKEKSSKKNSSKSLDRHMRWLRDLVEVLQNEFAVVARTVKGPDGVRFSTHYFNTEEEVERLSAVLENLSNK